MFGYGFSINPIDDPKADEAFIAYQIALDELGRIIRTNPYDALAITNAKNKSDAAWKEYVKACKEPPARPSTCPGNPW